MTLELKDGSFIVPQTIFDVLDIIEEELGTDVRQYLEGYFVEGEEPVDKDEHIQAVLETLEGIVTDMEKSKDMQYHLGRLRKTIRHEIGGDPICCL